MKTDKSEYFQRIADAVIPKRLSTAGAVLITGPKWCGKTTTSERLAGSVVSMADPANRERYEYMAKFQPEDLLGGNPPQLIDEWQQVPSLWDAVRYYVDRRGKTGQYILTGSAVPPKAADIQHSGTGRFARFMMRPMSLFESRESNGRISLSELFAGKIGVYAESQMKLPDYAFAICRGGWPLAVRQPREAALATARNYVDGLVESDMSRVDGVKRSARRVRSLLRSYSRLVTTSAALSNIRTDIESNETTSLSDDTVAGYVDALRGLFVIDELEAWHPKLLRKATVRESNTRHLVDPSIACAALGISPEDLLTDFTVLGRYFEELAIRDLRVYADTLDGEVLHYRDSAELETDAVIHRRDGSYALIEIKLFSDTNIDEGAANLKAAARKLDTSKMKTPSFLAVITGTGFAYRRDDGVLVLPLATLRP